MQSFVCGTRLCFGADAPAALAGLHAERVLLVTDPYFAENGTAARYAAAFPGAQVEQFSDVAPDPPLSLVARGVARLQALRPDTVLALGGGSAIDCAKGIAALVEGMKADDVIARCEGITCGFKPTSCPDQLSKALREAKAVSR